MYIYTSPRYIYLHGELMMYFDVPQQLESPSGFMYRAKILRLIINFDVKKEGFRLLFVWWLLLIIVEFYFILLKAFIFFQSFVIDNF